MSEGLVTAWHVEPGADLQRGQDVVDIETEKIVNVFESPASGILRRQLVAVDDTVPVGALLGVVAPAAVGDAEIDAFIEKFNAEFADVLTQRAEEDAHGPEPEVLDIAGRAARYLVMGEESGAPLLLLHGFGGDLNNWLFNQPALAATRRVFALDLPGHGGSAKVLSGAGLQALAEDVAAFVHTAELPPLHLAGHSLGGAVAIELARRVPQQVRSLTLLASAGLGTDIDGDYLRGFIAAARRKDLKPWIERLFADTSLVRREMLDDILKFKRLDHVTEILTSIADSVFADGRQALVLRDPLAALDMPRQGIWGAQDRIIPVSHSEGLAPAVTVHVLENAGHMVHMEKAAEVNALIDALLQDA
jgi:pyruvate dehydrogenase E2 component (dihydrolipoamide acetyltransferase)